MDPYRAAPKLLSAEELRNYIDTLRAAGVTGPVEIGGIKLTIAPVVDKTDVPAAKRNANKDYDTMLFACTEGIPDEEAAE